MKLIKFQFIFTFNYSKILIFRFILYGILFLAAANSQAYYVGDSLVQEGVHAFYNYDFDNSVEILDQAKKNINSVEVKPEGTQKRLFESLCKASMR